MLLGETITTLRWWTLASEARALLDRVLGDGKFFFLEKARSQILSRSDTGIVETGKDVWAFQQTLIAYGQKVGLKNGAKALN